ncbi:PEP/pyruvate-binding domain-containing protein [Streptomyces noursei]|uniref:PEP/pyruvate-binding domain-containing protein n=1 Tax=Streptomyces noursei TaxID=1971 RepID=UPI0035D7B3A4
MPDVVMLRDLRAGDATRAGAKAANLGELMSAGLPVPDGFCLPISVYRSTTAAALGPHLDALTARLTDGAADGEIADCARLLRKAILAVDLPSPLLDEVARAYQAVRPDGGGVAVRSSGTSEDSATASFAGQYHTELAVDSPEDVVAAVRRCWASLWQVHAIRYRERQRLPHAAAGMAVVVQALVPAESAGVMFTVDPRATTATDGAGDPPPAGRTVIESSWGYGEAVVGGFVTPDRFEVSRADARVARTQLAHKARMVVPAVAAGEGEGTVADARTGTAVVDVPPDRQDAASLTAEQAVALAGHGLAIEAHFGRPQDVEWAVHAGRIAILQARPLTDRAPAPTAPADVRWESPVDGAWWARISICDSWLPEPLSPLFATTLFPCLVAHWSQNWAGPAAEQLTNPLLPKPMSGTINGFAYLRLDYPMNRYPLRTVKLALNCYRFHLGPLERRWRTVILPRHVARLEAMSRTDLTRLATDDLLRLIAEAQELSGRYWAILGGLAWYWNIGEWLLATAYPRIAKPLKDTGSEVPGHGALLQGFPSKTSETTFALHDLARTEGDDDEAERAFETFLARYGHQVYHLDFVEPTPAEDPSTFRTTIAAYRDGRAADPRERMRTLARRRTSARAQMDEALRPFPLRRGALAALLSWNRRYGQVRDQALFHFTRGWPIMRRAYLELGRRLTTAGGLRSPDDVFFLTGDELHGELRTIGRGQPPKTWDDVVHRRRARRDEQKLLSPPPQVPAEARIFMGKVDVTSVALVGHHTKAEEGAGLHGSPVSPGRVTAPARRVFSVRDFPTFQAGDVLVAPYITPAWSPLLAIAGGVVTDTGGALSHGSIVAREYGIPAVMGTNNATKLIQDGQLVTVDGDLGRVY